MTQSVVAIIACSSYDEAEVYAAIKQGIHLLGGWEAFISPQESILLKPNLLCRARPEKAITTHPAVFGAVAHLLQEEGYTRLSYGDSPGSPAATPEKTAEISGLKAAAEKYGLPLADFNSAVQGELEASDYVITTAEKPIKPGNQVRMEDQ